MWALNRFLRYGRLLSLEWAWHFRRNQLALDSASDSDQEYISFIGSETIPPTFYILSDESSIPFYSSSNGYN